MSMSERKPFTLNGWHVLGAFVAFFGLIFAVNGAFMYQAIHTFPGQTVDNPYEAGIEYNHTLAQKAAEAELGWKAEVVKDDAAIRLMVVDSAGRPVPDLTVTGKMERPATEQGRRMIQLKEVSPGSYQVAVSGMTGAWDLSATARDKAGHVFEAQRRLIWP
jgi:nitrogen fixation protein FixH